jgi:hypothetical protein
MTTSLVGSPSISGNIFLRNELAACYAALASAHSGAQVCS